MRRAVAISRTMLRLAAERERLTVISDQHGAPTGAELIADASAHAIRAERRTTAWRHLPPAPPARRAGNGYASFVIEQARELRCAEGGRDRADRHARLPDRGAAAHLGLRHTSTTANA